MPHTITISDELHQRISAYYDIQTDRAQREEKGEHIWLDEWDRHDDEAHDLLDELTSELDLANAPQHDHPAVRMDPEHVNPVDDPQAFNEMPPTSSR